MAGSFARWIFQADFLPKTPLKIAPGPLPPARIEPPIRRLPSYTRIPFIGWLIAPEDLPEAAEMVPAPPKTDFLAAVFAAETLPPPPESIAGPRAGTFLSDLLSRDRLPPPVEKNDLREEGGHIGVRCEGCHEPIGSHITNGEMTAPMLIPASFELCTRCHRHLAARPDDFPQVNPQQHLEDNKMDLTDTVCTECHDPHSPF